MKELLRELAAERPTERELTHKVTRGFRDHCHIAFCSCGWSYMSSGPDESSRSSVRAAVKRHQS